MIVNKYLINDFEKIGIWSEDLKNEIILNEGSIQNINFNQYLDVEDKNYNKKVKRIDVKKCFFLFPEIRIGELIWGNPSENPAQIRTLQREMMLKT